MNRRRRAFDTIPAVPDPPSPLETARPRAQRCPSCQQRTAEYDAARDAWVCAPCGWTDRR